MKNETTAIRPCRFCGSMPQIFRFNDECAPEYADDELTVRYHIGCLKCGALGDFTSLERAITAWNEENYIASKQTSRGEYN